jgi:hypothetical protein
MIHLFTRHHAIAKLLTPLSIPDGAVQDLILIRGENITYKNKMVKSRSNTPPKGDNYTSFFSDVFALYCLWLAK